ncbi:GNAT family N-acetyltransferase [Aquabacter cavernae]|uniref:GNAT family N-acetyltransferase n=1 Tax=Aquabacter cavernae TaxID=2496029 RepID=UPI000F8D7664|nr:GNAT family N-acetyltransferase [Aquabacter cavernae]
MSSEAVRIAPLEAHQRGDWEPLWRAYQAFYQVDLPEAVTATAFARMLDPAEPTHGALAWQGERAVGLVHYIEHRTNWSVADTCYLQDLFVAPGVRGGGVGRALISHVYDFAAARGCSRVYWLTQEGNAAARRLYDEVAERSGFIQYRWTPPA